MSFRLESPIHGPKISVFWGILPQDIGHIVQTPKRHFLERNDAFWAFIDLDLMHSATRGLGKENKKKEKETVENWLFAQTTHVAVSKSMFACRVASSVYSATHLIAYRLIAYPFYSVRIWKNKNKTYSFLL